MGNDFFGLADVGLDKELGVSSLNIPIRLFRGEPKAPSSEQQQQADSYVTPVPSSSYRIASSLTLLYPAHRSSSTSELPFPPPPPYPLLTPAAITTHLPALLQPYFLQRQSIPDLGLVEDFAQAVRPKTNARGKVPPVSGRIKRPAAAVAAGGQGATAQEVAVVPPAKKKKKKAVVVVASGDDE